MIKRLFIVLLLLLFLTGCSGSSNGVKYIYNKRSGKFHYPYCKSVGDMAEHNKLYWFGSRNELLDAHPDADPCHNCNP